MNRSVLPFVLKMLNNNPTASTKDRAAAENVIRGMRNALNGK